MKICKLCHEEKDEDQFGNLKNRPDGKRDVCRDCRALYQTQKKKSTTAMEIIEAPQVSFRGKSQGEVLQMAIELRMEYYRDYAIEAIFDLAMMPPSKSTLTNSIKLQAARLLAGPLPGDRVSEKVGDAPLAVEDVLQKLNESFHKNAPRIREVRERVMVLEDAKTLPAETTP